MAIKPSTEPAKRGQRGRIQETTPATKIRENNNQNHQNKIDRNLTEPKPPNLVGEAKYRRYFFRSRQIRDALRKTRVKVERRSLGSIVREVFVFSGHQKRWPAVRLATAQGCRPVTGFPPVKHKYTIAPRSTISEARKSPLLLLEGRQKDSAKAKKKGISILTKTQVDAEFLKTRSLTAEEAAAAAAQAVAEAEVAIVEAEKAAREAELAEAEAEAAKVFAKAAEKALKSRMLDTCYELVQMA
ncbi:telomere repeat-binding factor 2-like [Hibiscus syriacus]|uniref:telomere repeat-binding factor 2-like n=1 Tax=Hibiscus syriacus TaxID=106335 RepID=UPI001922700F|nr:telomere repeat-binding factor 2-like [Hibiscus syriacus]